MASLSKSCWLSCPWCRAQRIYPLVWGHAFLLRALVFFVVVFFLVFVGEFFGLAFLRFCWWCLQAVLWGGVFVCCCCSSSSSSSSSSSCCCYWLWWLSWYICVFLWCVHERSGQLQTSCHAFVGLMAAMAQTSARGQWSYWYCQIIPKLTHSFVCSKNIRWRHDAF